MFVFKDAATVSDVLARAPGNPEGMLSGSFPLPSLPTGIAWVAEWPFILKTAFVVAMVGIIESLMTLQLIDEITETRGHGNRECIAQGGANFLSGLFGGMGGCAMIGQSLINIKSGGRGRTSGIVAALALAAFILVGGPVIEKIPIAALVGVMFMVVIGTFEWSSLKTFGRVPLSEIIVIVAVTLVTVFLHDLATAVFIGIILSALVFAWESSKHVFVTLEKDTPEERIYAAPGTALLRLRPRVHRAFPSALRRAKTSSSTSPTPGSATCPALRPSTRSPSAIATPGKSSISAMSPPTAAACSNAPAAWWTSRSCPTIPTTWSPGCGWARTEIGASFGASPAYSDSLPKRRNENS